LRSYSTYLFNKQDEKLIGELRIFQKGISNEVDFSIFPFSEYYKSEIRKLIKSKLQKLISLGDIYSIGSLIKEESENYITIKLPKWRLPSYLHSGKIVFQESFDNWKNDFFTIDGLNSVLKPNLWYFDNFNNEDSENALFFLKYIKVHFPLNSFVLSSKKINEQILFSKLPNNVLIEEYLEFENSLENTLWLIQVGEDKDCSMFIFGVDQSKGLRNFIIVAESDSSKRYFLEFIKDITFNLQLHWG
jgi:hypothetical protein